MMLTSIIIPTYNNEEYTIRCMESIGNHTENYIILWVDDASSKKSVEKVLQFLNEKTMPYELIAKEENSGFAKSVNLGLTRALELESDFIVIQNNDTEVYGDWLDRMIDVAGREGRIGVVGPVTSPCESWQSVENLKKEFSQFAALPDYTDNPGEYAQQISELYKNQYFVVNKRLAFFLVLFKTEIIKEIGMLSEEYGHGFGEDDDYMLRLRQNGYFGAIAKGVFVFHNHNTTFSSRYSPQEIQEMRKHNREILYKKFKKGRFRPEDTDDIWDIEEAIAYAKQLEKKNELLEKKNEHLKEVQKSNKEVLAQKIIDIKEKNRIIKEKNGRIGEQIYYLKKQKEQIESITSSLQNNQLKVQELKAEQKKLREDLAATRTQLEKVFQSSSWRLTAPLRKFVSLIKKV